MPTTREQRLLALAEAQGGPEPAAGMQRAFARTAHVGPPQERELTVSVRVGHRPDANGDIFSEDVLHQVMMQSAQEAVSSSETVEFSLPADSVAARLIREGHIRHVSMGEAVGPDPMLVNLFMDGEARQAAEVLGRVADPTPATPDAISFEGEGVEGRTTPNERVRFQVGRQDPPPISFNRETFSGPSEGRVVSRRGADGRFRVQTPPARAVPQIRERPAPPIATTSRAPEPPPRTRYERLLGPDPFGDD